MKPRQFTPGKGLLPEFVVGDRLGFGGGRFVFRGLRLV